MKKFMIYGATGYTNIEQKIKEIDRATWARAVEHSFEHKPEEYPRCSSTFTLKG